MPSPRLSLPQPRRQWIPTERETLRLTAEGRETWKTLVQRDIYEVTGAESVDAAVTEALAAMPPSPAWVDRYIFVPSGPRALAVVNVTVTPKVDGWRDELVARCEHPVGLTCDPEFSELDVPWSDDGLVALRCEEYEGFIRGAVTFAASWDDHVVLMRGTSRDMLTVVELRLEGEAALAGASLR